MNLNALAKAVTLAEGKKIPMNIGQIKECLRCLGQILSEMQMGELGETLGLLMKIKHPKSK